MVKVGIESKVATFTRFVSKFSKFAYWFQTSERSRSQAGASDWSSLLAMSTSLKIATNTRKHKSPGL